MAKNTEIEKRTDSVAMTVRNLLERNKQQLVEALPKGGVTADRLMRMAVGAINRTPGLQKCTSVSLFSSIVQSALLGLEPCTPLGEAYLVPYGDTCTFIPGYRGLINLARRSGKVSLVYADAIYENDEYTIERGLEPRLIHRPKMFGPRGEVLGYYAVYHTTDGSKDFEVMTLDEINSIRARSKARNSGPWVTDYDEMAKKTVIRRLSKRMPMSVELARAIDLDNAAAMGETPDYGDVSDAVGPLYDGSQDGPNIIEADAEGVADNVDYGGAPPPPPPPANVEFPPTFATGSPDAPSVSDMLKAFKAFKIGATQLSKYIEDKGMASSLSDLTDNQRFAILDGVEEIAAEINGA